MKWFLIFTAGFSASVVFAVNHSPTEILEAIVLRMELNPEVRAKVREKFLRSEDFTRALEKDERDSPNWSKKVHEFVHEKAIHERNGLSFNLRHDKFFELAESSLSERMVQREVNALFAPAVLEFTGKPETFPQLQQYLKYKEYEKRIGMTEDSELKSVRNKLAQYVVANPTSMDAMAPELILSIEFTSVKTQLDALPARERVEHFRKFLKPYDPLKKVNDGIEKRANSWRRQIYTKYLEGIFDQPQSNGEFISAMIQSFPTGWPSDHVSEFSETLRKLSITIQKKCPEAAEKIFVVGQDMKPIPRLYIRAAKANLSEKQWKAIAGTFSNLNHSISAHSHPASEKFKAVYSVAPFNLGQTDNEFNKIVQIAAREDVRVFKESNTGGLGPWFYRKLQIENPALAESIREQYYMAELLPELFHVAHPKVERVQNVFNPSRNPAHPNQFSAEDKKLQRDLLNDLLWGDDSTLKEDFLNAIAAAPKDKLLEHWETMKANIPEDHLVALRHEVLVNPAAPKQLYRDYVNKTLAHAQGYRIAAQDPILYTRLMNGDWTPLLGASESSTQALREFLLNSKEALLSMQKMLALSPLPNPPPGTVGRGFGNLFEGEYRKSLASASELEKFHKIYSNGLKNYLKRVQFEPKLSGQVIVKYLTMTAGSVELYQSDQAALSEIKSEWIRTNQWLEGHFPNENIMVELAEKELKGPHSLISRTSAANQLINEMFASYHHHSKSCFQKMLNGISFSHLTHGN